MKLIPLIFSFNACTLLSIVLSGHAAVNNSDVLIAYAGHSDALPVTGVIINDEKVAATRKSADSEVIFLPNVRLESDEYLRNDEGHTAGGVGETEPKSAYDMYHVKDETPKKDPKKEDTGDGSGKADVERPALNGDVVFVKTLRVKSGGRTDEETPSGLSETLEGNKARSVYDLVAGVGGDIRVETDRPSKGGDIVFVTGKNAELSDPIAEKEDATDAEKVSTTKSNPALDCVHLNCNNTLSSVCGGKIEHNKWRYRLFLNECYYRKVNCALTFKINRFVQVPKSKCANVAAHIPERPYDYKPLSDRRSRYNNEQYEKTRRAFASRRSSSIKMDGTQCQHACPATCSEEYAPECAVSANGLRRVFLNHCQLDLNSCTHGLAWRRQPLADCIGRQQAELRENRAFIGWMQRVGIMDAKGRLVES